MRRSLIFMLCSLITLCLSACIYVPMEKDKEPDITVIGETVKKPEVTGYVIPNVKLLNEGITYGTGEYVDRDIAGKLYPYSYYLYGGTDREVYVALYNGIYNIENAIDISQYDITSGDVYSMLLYMLYDNPDFYYVNREFSFDVDGSDKITKVNMSYNYTADEVLCYDLELKEATKDILSECNKLSSSYDKLLLIHDYLIVNTVYHDNSDTIIQGLLQGKGNAQAISKCFVYLCRELDIMSTIAIGTSGTTHIWNKVYDGTGWFNVDTGMDNVDSNVVLDWVKHGFFGLSDEELTTHREYTSTEDLYYPAPKANISCGYLSKILCFEYPDEQEIASKIADEIIVAKSEGRNYVEFSALTDQTYNYLKNEVFSEDNLGLYDILELAAVRGSLNIETESCGATLEDWNKSCLMYVFDK